MASLTLAGLPAIPSYWSAMSVSLMHRDLGGTGLAPLVILHGMLGSSRNWQTAGRDLAQRWHVLAVDLRNHGASPHDGVMGYEAMMQDVANWMDSRGIASADILGHSMGGKVAMLLACRHPDRVKSLIVVDIAPKDYYWVEHRSEFAAMEGLDLTSLASRAEAEARFEPLVPSLWLRKFLATNLERADGGGWKWTVNLPVISKAVADLEKNPLKSSDRFEGPALFITGGRSSYVKPEDHAQIRKHFPQARIETLEGAGHNPHLDQREAFACLTRSAAGIPPAGTP